MTTEAATRPPPSDAERLDALCVSAIRTLAIDAVERANSGHPGLPLAMAPAAYVLYTRHMRHNPADPDWPDRDRFVLSAGHGSALLYASLHLCGYDLPLRELERFRQWGSRTPGHPERGETPGVETTTGPLGQGFSNGIGMAMAERFLRERYGAGVMDHRVFGICSDGDLMEGVAAEAASLAGHLGLGRIVYLYDDNGITIDGSTALSFNSEDVDARFRSYGWHVAAVDDANDLDGLDAAVAEAVAEREAPSLIRVRSVIGWPAPTRQGTPAAHGQALGEAEVRATKKALGWNPDLEFHVPDEVYDRFAGVAERGANLQRTWEKRMALWREDNPGRAREWDQAWSGRPSGDVAACLPRFEPEDGGLATRAAAGQVMAAFADQVPTMVGGAADLAESTKTEFPGEAGYSRERASRNVHWGVREHAMAAAVNGMALHGGIVRPYGSTFLVFSDYMRPAIRLSALMRLPVAWVFTHDSIGLGEDGPTHQPVEHYAALRAIPGLTVIRPADAVEAAEAWRFILEELEGPACLLLSRQSLPVLRRSRSSPRDLARGAYIVAERPSHAPALDAVIVATGSEVAIAVEAQAALASEGIGVHVVSMPSWELFEAQPSAYQESVLPPYVPVVSVEAGVSLGWSRWASRSISLDRFGASAPGAEVTAKLGFTAERVAAVTAETLAHAN